jgi:hypothetical protein
MFRKTCLLIIALIFIAASAFADGAVISFLLSGLTDLSQTTLSGGQVYTYAAGTTTPKAIYADKALTSAYSQPLILDSDGRAIAYGDGLYKFVIKDSASNTVFTADNVEINSLAAVLADASDPFGTDLTQTNLTVTNLTAASATITTLAALQPTTLNGLSMNSTTITAVATATTPTGVPNLQQVTNLIGSSSINTDNLMYRDGSNASPAVTFSGTFNPAGGIYNAYAKFHRVATITLALPNTWTDVEWDFTPPDENSFGFTLLSSSTVEVASASLLQINGCTRPRWTGAAATVAIIASRVVYSTDAGVTWSEARCLQAVNGRENGENEVGTMHYMGSIRATAGTRVKLQVRVNDVQMLFAGWPTFDNPVSATINFFTSGL